MLPTADAPVKNLAASIHPPSRLIKNCVDPPPKNMHGMGTSTYMRADNIGHQLLYSTQACPKQLEIIYKKQKHQKQDNIYKEKPHPS